MTIRVRPSRVTFACRLEELPDGYFVKLGHERWREASLSEVCIAQRDGWPPVYHGGKIRLEDFDGDSDG